MKKGTTNPWYAGDHKDALFYLMIAIFLLEMAIGGVAFFYGIIHAAPEIEGGPPIARFPWLAWVLSSVLAPVILILIVHIAGTLAASAIEHNDGENKSQNNSGYINDEHLPEGMKRFYASIRHAPAIVVLGALLLFGASLFFVDGALAFLANFATVLVPYLPWIVTSIAGLLGLCFLGHAFMVFRQRKMENEYAWRREVLEKTGLVIVDKTSLAVPQNNTQAALVRSELQGLPENAIDITPGLSANEDNSVSSDNKKKE